MTDRGTQPLPTRPDPASCARFARRGREGNSYPFSRSTLWLKPLPSLVPISMIRMSGSEIRARRLSSSMRPWVPRNRATSNTNVTVADKRRESGAAKQGGAGDRGRGRHHRLQQDHGARDGLEAHQDDNQADGWSTKASTRNGLPLPLRILSGAANTTAPVAGSWSRLVRHCSPYFPAPCITEWQG